MLRTRLWSWLLTCAILLSSAPSAFSAQQNMKPGGAVTKLGRGAVNVVTGWVEIPKRIYETSAMQGNAAGWTWGLLRGLGYGFVRTAAGFYEVVTFPVPQPADYASVIHPEYVFVDELELPPASTTTSSTTDYKYR